MGIYLLNISVDTKDPHPEYIPEDLSINDQESIVEIVVEKILGFENAIKEYDDHDSEDHNKKKNSKIELLAFENKVNQNSPCQTFKKKKIYPDFEIQLTIGFKEVDSPPPKIWFVFRTITPLVDPDMGLF